MKGIVILFILLGVFSAANADVLDVHTDMSIYNGSYEGGQIRNGSTLDMYGGTITSVFGLSYDSPENMLNMYDGYIHSISAGGGIINMYGGEIEYLDAGINSVYLYGGNIHTMGSSDAPIHVYGYGFQYIDNPGPIGLNDGYLIGYWEDNTSFNIRCDDSAGLYSTYYDHVILHEVPEPATLFFLGLGAIMFRRKR
jgi:hypothetical protein